VTASGLAYATLMKRLPFRARELDRAVRGREHGVVAAEAGAGAG
jgi:hypothetical protein